MKDYTDSFKAINDSVGVGHTSIKRAAWYAFVLGCWITNAEKKYVCMLPEFEDTLYGFWNTLSTDEINIVAAYIEDEFMYNPDKTKVLNVEEDIQKDYSDNEHKVTDKDITAISKLRSKTLNEYFDGIDSDHVPAEIHQFVNIVSKLHWKLLQQFGKKLPQCAYYLDIKSV